MARVRSNRNICLQGVSLGYNRAMPKVRFKTALFSHLVIVTFSLMAGLQAQAPATEARSAGPPAVPPETAAYRTETAPVLDGDILGDPAWQTGSPVVDFWQTTPVEGQPASERTEVRILYDDRNLYIGVICYDRSPEEIIVSDSRRDASLAETDSFQFILDTFNDGQNGFVFGTNPAAIEYDGQVSREGQGTGGFGGGGGGARQQRGSGGGFNLNWDGSWSVETRISEIGWSAEFSIPFRTLRYSLDQEQTWGVNFQRNIRRRNENAFWAPISRQFNLYRLSYAGTLTGLEIERQRNFQAMPYLLGQVRDREVEAKKVWTGELGADAKINFTPSLTLDLTYNTDFAQVEVDTQQINLDRFNLFFPEKRPFFLENAGFFSVGTPGRTELFFSRQIGIGEAGNVIPILGGARLSGKLGNFNNVGLLNMQTEGIDGFAQANNFTVVRYNRELPNRSSLGGIFVNRQATSGLAGGSAAPGDHNQTYGMDGRWGIGEYGDINGYLAATSTPGLSGKQHALELASNYNSSAWRLRAGYSEVGENFNPEVGFLRREGVRRLDLGIFLTHRVLGDFLGLHELRPHTSYQGFWDFDGFHESGFWHIDSHWEWRSGHEVHTGVNFTREGVRESFTIYEDPKNPAREVIVPPGTYDHAEAAFVAFTNRGAPVGVNLMLTAGGFFGGTRLNLRPSLRVRLGEAFRAEVSLNRNDIDLPTGSFVTNLGRGRVTYSFTPRLSIQSLVQYNDSTRSWSSNIRFTWLQAANTGLFIVFNHNRGAGDVACSAGRLGMDDCVPSDRSLILKFSKLFDLLD